MRRKKIPALQAPPGECGVSRQVFISKTDMQGVKLICSLPKGHMDGPLFSRQVTHRDEVFQMEWKGRPK